MGHIKHFFGILIGAAVTVVLASCSLQGGTEAENHAAAIIKLNDGQGQGQGRVQQIQMPDENAEVAVVTTSKGVFKMRLFPEVAPLAVDNFKKLVNSGFYEQRGFVRIIPKKLIQIGPSEAEIAKMADEEPTDEVFPLETDKDLCHLAFSVGMVRRDHPQKYSSDDYFYIIAKQSLDAEYRDILDKMTEIGYSKEMLEAYEVLGGAPQLDKNYTVFAQVYEGFDVVLAINGVATDAETGVAKEMITIESITIEKYVNDKE